MNMQNKLYTIQFFHCLTTSCVESPRAAIVEPAGFLKLTDFTHGKKTKFAEKFELPGKRRDSCPADNAHL